MKLRRWTFIPFAVFRTCRLLVLTLLCVPALALRKLFGPMAGPRMLRWYFERCGGGYLKIGQLLATRYDLLRPEYCEELGTLLDSLRPVPTSAILATLEHELGADISRLFTSIEETPIATASLAQVHGAVLRSGEAVVVKVLKPRIESELAVDLAFLKVTGRVLDALPVLKGLDLKGLVAELTRMAREEVDLRLEALNTSELHDRMAQDAVAHTAPAVYWEESTRRVLTLERMRGVSVREMLTAINNGDQAALDAWADRGITPERTAVVLLRSVFEQTIRFRVFNCDPHPSNLIVSDGGRLNWVDFGLTGWIDEHQWDLQLRFRAAIVNSRIHAAYLALLETLEPIPADRDLRGFEQEIKQSLHSYLLAAGHPQSSLQQKSTGYFFLKTLAALRRARLPVAVSTIQLYRTILIADIVMWRLYPNIDWVGHLRHFMEDLSSELLTRAVEEPFSSSTTYRLAQAPFAIANTIEWIGRRLPELGRQTVYSLSVGERLILTSLRLLRGAIILAALSVVPLAVADPDVGTSSLLAQLVTNAARHPWPALGICAILVLTLNTYVRRLESR